MRRVIALTAVFAAACSVPPDASPGADFTWTTALVELDDAILSVCEGNERVIAVGGRAGAGAVYEWDGDSWDVAVLPDDTDVLWWCWIDDRDRAIAVGERATVIRSGRNRKWTADDTGDAVPAEMTLFGVWGANGDDVFAVGGSFAPLERPGIVVQYNGSYWARVDDANIPAQVLFKVWGTAGNDVWVVGAGGTILHHDGLDWTEEASPTDDQLIAVWGTGPSDVYAVGGLSQGIVLHYDGAAWGEFDTTPERLSGVWTDPGEPLYVAGDRGYLARYGVGTTGRADARLRVQTTVLATIDYHSLSASDGIVFAGGRDLLAGAGEPLRGTVVTHNGKASGPINVPDPPPDGGVPDAALPDATPGLPDATPLPGHGDECGPPPDFCEADLECWGLIVSDVFLCTERCTNAVECMDKGYGPNPCCTQPGFQTLETVCIPGEYVECNP